MTDPQSTQIADEIFSVLSLIEHEDKSKEEKIKLIKPIVERVAQEQRKVGRNQILNYMEDEVKTLRKNTNS